MMKKIKLLLFIVLISGMLSAQEKGSYIGISGVMGGAGFNYDYKGISEFSSNKILLGGNANVDYTYYFSRHWGASVGVGMSLYRTSAKYSEDQQNNYYNLGYQIDNDPNLGAVNEYELRARLLDWGERQKAYYIDIPIMLKYQTKFGSSKRHGVYFGIGAKIQIPVIRSFEVMDGEFNHDTRLNISGYYKDIDLDLGYGANVDKHGFGTIHNPNSALDWNGNIGLRPSYSGIAEVGFLFGLAKRMDLLLGAYFDYGFNNIKKRSSKALLEAPSDYVQNSENKIGNGIVYNGLINSNGSDKVNLMTYGVKVGIRIKLGKLQGEDPYLKDVYNSNKSATTNNESNISAKQRREEQKSLKNIEDMLREMLENQKQGNTNTIDQIIGGNALDVNDILLERVYFDFNTVNIRNSEVPVLNRKIDFLKKDPSIKIKVIGNTCSLASDEINMKLGHQRAESVKDYLVKNGIDSKRITITSNGKENPLLPNTTLENRKVNRRCDFEFIKD